MGAFRNAVRSLIPGNDQQLAADLSTQRRADHRRSVTKTARAGQAWEDRDRAQTPSTTKWFRRS